MKSGSGEIEVWVCFRVKSFWVSFSVNQELCEFRVESGPDLFQGEISFGSF